MRTGSKTTKCMDIKMKKSFYSNGLPFDGPLDINLKDQVGRVQGNKASLIIIDGFAGEGKTTLMVEVMDFVNSLYDMKQVKLDVTDHPQLSMGGKEFLKAFNMSKVNNIVILGYDEAGDLDRTGAMKRFNQMLIDVFSKFRGFKIIIVLALLNFNRLDNRIFDLGVPRGLLHCEKRNNKYGNYRAYSLSRMNWIRYWYNKLPLGSRNQCYDKVEPNFRGHFLDLEPERSHKLDLLSTRSKDKSLLEAEVEMQGLISYAKLASKLGKSLPWVRMKVAEYKIKHKRVIGHAKYFDEAALNRLTEIIEAK